MKISLQWLRDFLDLRETPAEVGDRLTLVGLALDGLESVGDDTVLELDVTANRGDCLSHLGVARELSAVYDVDIRRPEIAVQEGPDFVEDAVGVSIDASPLCRRYCARYVSGVTVGPSPDWLVRRLEAVGVRPINNIADITNYVLMELGHPLHAFDADTLEGSRIVVRRAAPGERIRTLDGEERSLDPSMLVIADSRKPVALAGIMGGFDTEISEKTTNVLLESAWFDPISVRKTGKSLNLGTEASYRFERGADVEMAQVALDRTARLIGELAGGAVHRGVIDVYPGRAEPPEVRLRGSRIAGLLGCEITGEDVNRVFRRLQFEIVESRDADWRVRVPTHRHDIAREEDLVEEVARHYGYDRFPSTLPAWSGQGQHLERHAEETAARNSLAALGYSETCSLAFGDPETQALFAPDVEPVVIDNPLSGEAPILRTSLVPSVLASLQWNLNRGIRDLTIYEIAKVYAKSGERRRLVMAATGAVRPQSVHATRTEASFYTLKGDVESLLHGFDVDLEPSAEDLPSYFHPGRSLRLGSVATIGELHATCHERFKLRQKTYVAEIRIEDVFAAGLKKIAAVPIPKYPAVRRDLSLLVDHKIPYREIIQVIKQAKIPELIALSPFDKLDRGPFPDSCYSLAVTLVFQSAERTLTDAEIQGFETRVLEELGTLGVGLRG